MNQTVRLGKTDLMTSEVGIGTNSWGTGRNADPALQATYQAALDSGITFFDTAELYQFGGSERTLGLFLPATSGRWTLASKFFPWPWRLSRGALHAALRRSLDRLAIPRVDLYMTHYPLFPVSIETWMAELARCVQEGLARAVGVSNYSADQLRRAYAALAARGVTLASNEVEYSLLKRDVERNGTAAACKELGVTLIAYRPLARGVLAGKFSAANPPGGLRGASFTRGFLTRMQPVVELVGRTAAARGKTSSQVALNWLLCKGTLPIPGAHNPDRVRENAGAMGWRLTEAEVRALDDAEERLRRGA
ncbi:MAG TPA: aldo/keto reductase [Spirochaetia bacterium]|nr:aldo/keto reductase [Spirochaetia bacterium]